MKNKIKNSTNKLSQILKTKQRNKNTGKRSRKQVPSKKKLLIPQQWFPNEKNVKEHLGKEVKG